MKILNILTYYVPHRTGLTIYVQRLSEGLAKRGHEVTVLTSQYSKSLAREEIINRVRVVRLPAGLRISRGVLMPSFPISVYGLIKQADLVVINTPILESALTAFLAKWQRKRVIITHHGDLVLPPGWLNSIIQHVVYALYSRAGRGAFKITGYSNDYAQHSQYLSRFREKVRVIYPPIEFPQPSPAGVHALRQRLGLEGQKIIGYAGRFVREKRPDRLVSAIPHIIKQMPNIKIVFAGEYEIKYEKFFQQCKPLLDQYQDYLIFLGLVRDAQTLADFYAVCDVLVLPSETECFALVQAEAMLCGTPLVANDTPGGREPVRVTGMGKVVYCADARKLAQAIVAVISHRSSYTRPRAVIAEIFNFERTITEYEKLFQEALHDAGGKRD